MDRLTQVKERPAPAFQAWRLTQGQDEPASMTPAESRRGFLKRVAPLPARPQDGPLRAALVGACLEAQGVACRLCEDRCEPRAIRFRPAPGGRATLMLDRTACDGCGDCIRPCPAGALDLIPFTEESAA